MTRFYFLVTQDAPLPAVPDAGEVFYEGALDWPTSLPREEVTQIMRTIAENLKQTLKEKVPA